MKLPPFREYLSTISKEQVNLIVRTLNERLDSADAVELKTVEDTITLISMLMVVHFLSDYHGWLSDQLDPASFVREARDAARHAEETCHNKEATCEEAHTR